MKIRQRTIKKARIEIIPMIDVIFFLLVFFMISSLAIHRNSSIPVNLPKTSTSSHAKQENFILILKKDGSLFVNKTAVTLETLKSELVYQMRNHPQDVVVVHADEGAAYGQVVQMMEIVKSAGIRRFALATEHTQGILPIRSPGGSSGK